MLHSDQMSRLGFLCCRVAVEDGCDVALQMTSVFIPCWGELQVVDCVGDPKSFLNFGLSEGAEGVSERMVTDCVVGGMV